MKNKKMNADDVKHVLMERILSQEYLPGEMIPSERQLSERYGIGRSIVRNAIDELVEMRLLIRIQGKGTFVKKSDYNKVAFGILNESENTSFTALVNKFGIALSNKLLATGKISGSHYFAEKLGIHYKEEIYGIHRIRYGNKEPIAVEYTYLPYGYFPDIENYNFEQVSLYAYLSSKNRLPHNFRETMYLKPASEKIAAYLQLPPSGIINYTEIIGFDAHNTIVEYTESYSRTDKLEVRFVSGV